MRAVRGILISLFCFGLSAQAGVFEVGGGFSLSRSNYNSGSYTKTTSYQASLGYYFSQDSELEFSYQDSTTRNFVDKVQDITYRDRVYSLNLLYHFFDEKAKVKPFVRIGLGQLNRDATGTYEGGAFSPPGRLDQISVIGGFGVKARITDRVGFRADATTFLSGGNISTWQDNFTLNFGGSFFF
jgi:outer membrane protein W